jgi:hypothetical protein
MFSHKDFFSFTKQNSSTSLNPIQKILLFFIISISVSLAFFLRLPLIGDSFWLDEAAQALEVTRPLREQLELARDFQPPLLHILLHAAQYLGTSEWWLRLVGAVIPGLLSIAFGLAAIKKKTGSLTTLWIGLLLATSSLHVFFSQELRPYALPAAVGSASWFVLLNLLQTVPKTKQRINTSIWFGFLTGLGLYSSYLYPFLLIGQLVYILWAQKTLKEWFSVSFMPLLIATSMFVPWVPSFLEQLQVGSELRVSVPGWDQVVSTPQWKALALVPGKFVFGVMSLSGASVIVISGISAAIAALLVGRFSLLYPFKTNLSGKASGWFGSVLKGITLVSKFTTMVSGHANETARKKKFLDIFIFSICWFVLPFVTAWLVSWFVPVVSPKRLLFALPGFYLFLFAAIDFLHSKYSEKVQSQEISTFISRVIVQPATLLKLWLFITLLLINIGTLTMYWSNPHYQRENWRALEQQIVSDFPATNTILVFGFTGQLSPWAWYDSQELPYVATGYLTTAIAQENAIQKIKHVSEYEYVLVFDYLRDLTDPEDTIIKQVEMLGYSQVTVLDYPNIGFVRVFTRPNTVLGQVQ